MHSNCNIKLTEDTVVFCILFSRRLGFWNLHQMSWLNNYVLEDACRSRRIGCLCGGCHYIRRRRLIPLHIHMHSRVCVHFIHLMANKQDVITLSMRIPVLCYCASIINCCFSNSLGIVSTYRLQNRQFLNMDG